MPLSKQAKVVVIGSGIVGCAAAYHLAKLGWTDILVIDKGELYENDGSTSHAPGGIVPLSHNKLLTQMGTYTSDLITSLDHFKDDQRTWNHVGQIEVCTSQARLDDMIRLQGTAKGFGFETEILNAKESVERLPLLNEDLITGSLFVPQGLIVKGAHVSGALAREAIATGRVEFVAHAMMTDIEVENGAVVAVHTAHPDMPRIVCEHVLLAANIWAPALTEKMGIALPLMAYEHQYIVTNPLPEMKAFDRANKAHEVVYPTMRDLDSAMYFRQHWDSYGIGSYWHKAHMVRPRDVGKSAIHPFTPDDFFGEPWEQAQRVLPAFKSAELDMETAINGMFAFSIDGMPIIGPSPVRGFWTAVASWLTHAGGVGKSVAEWMVHGESEWDMRQAHISRFHPFQTTEAFTTVITKKNYREIYDIIHPKQPPTEPRDVRRSPFAERLNELDVEYTAFAGLELPNWFNANEPLLEKYAGRVPAREGWAAEYWSPLQGAEHLEMRENVGLMDLTGLSLIEISGSGALAYVDYLCSNKMDVAVGRAVYTLLLTDAGGVKRDLTVTRMGVDKFWLHVGEGSLPMDLAWAKHHAPNDGSVTITDISNNYTALGLWGPNARKVLEKVTATNVSHESFPYFTGQWIEIGVAPVYALRISYVGELGWELHIPMDMAVQVWDVLWDAGCEFDMPAIGLGAMDSMRLEKGYRLWGADVYTEYNAYQAGLGWTVKLKKDDFIGKCASALASTEPLKKKLCAMTFNEEGMALGYEAILVDGKAVGHVTSANHAYSVGVFVVYGYLPAAVAKAGQAVEIEYFGKTFPATVVDEPIFDPKMKKMKA
ncbi:MAG: heterotetrameric sarcosine oxidase gamma subunit [Candidatus Promineifilaceae bacterium]